MIEILPLSKENFNDLIFLLNQRGETPINYYKWKYLDQPYDFYPLGFIAYDLSQPIGCIGNINRIFVDERGKEHNSTWFADWYVSEKGRGRGIGELLIKSIYDLSEFGCGIPGPEKAQIIASKAGYSQMNYLRELKIILNPFDYAFIAKADSNILYKLSYGIYLWAINSKMFGSETDDLLFSKFTSTNSENKLADLTIPDGVPHFKRDVKFLNWIERSPIIDGKKINWWYVQGHDIFAFGLVEEDRQNGYSVAKVFEAIPFYNGNTTLKKVSAILNANGVDLIKYIIIDTRQRRKSIRQTNLPFFVRNSKHFQNLHLSMLDKESSWINLRFK